MALLRRARSGPGALRRISIGEWSLLLRAWGFFWIIGTLLDLGVALPEVRRRMAPRGTRRRFEWPDDRGSDLVALAARIHPRRPLCLEQAICQEALMTRAGLAPAFCIGVRREGRRLEAHAWIESERCSGRGEVAERRRFAVLLSGAEPGT